MSSSLSEWRPISSAPKDGESILVFERLATGDYYHIAYWTESGENIHSGEREPGWTEEGDGYTGCIEPTHWQPLPNPPEQSK